MYTKEEIEEIFGLMRLLTPEERDYFQKFSKLSQESKSMLPYTIITDNQTRISDMENKDAKLERNS